VTTESTKRRLESISNKDLGSENRPIACLYTSKPRVFSPSNTYYSSILSQPSNVIIMSYMSRFHSTAAKYSRAFSRLEAEAVVVVINFSTTAVAGAVAAT